MAFSTHDPEKGLEHLNASREMADTPSVTDESPEKSKASTPEIPDVEFVGPDAPVATVLDWTGPDDPGITLSLRVLEASASPY